MKKEGHPELNPVCFVDVSTSKEFLTLSNIKSKQKKEINGVEYYVVIRDVTSSSHPVYTNEKRFVDSAGRIDKFNSKFSRTRPQMQALEQANSASE